MPSKSEKQHNFMVMACHDPEFAKKHNIDQKVACEFVEADRKKKEEEKKKTEQEEKKKPAFVNWKNK